MKQIYAYTPRTLEKLNEMKRDGLVIPIQNEQRAPITSNQPINGHGSNDANAPRATFVSNSRPASSNQNTGNWASNGNQEMQVQDSVNQICKDACVKSDNFYIRNNVRLGCNMREKLVQKKLEIKSKT